MPYTTCAMQMKKKKNHQDWLLARAKTQENPQEDAQPYPCALSRYAQHLQALGSVLTPNWSPAQDGSAWNTSHSAVGSGPALISLQGPRHRSHPKNKLPWGSGMVPTLNGPRALEQSRLPQEKNTRGKLTGVRGSFHTQYPGTHGSLSSALFHIHLQEMFRGKD